MTEVSVVKKEDYHLVAEFLAEEEKNKSLDKKFWLSRFNEWWDKNPSYSENMERGWVLKDKNKVVGFVGDIPTRFQFFGKEIKAFNGTNWRVFPEYRRQSMQLFFKQLGGSEIVFITTPSDEPVKLINSLKLPLLPRGKENEHNYIKSVIIVDVKNLLRLKPSTRLKQPLKFFASIFESIMNTKALGDAFSLVINSILLGYQNIKLRKLHKEGKENVKLLSRADTSFDELWKRTKNLYENTNVRTAEQINYYINNKNHKNIIFGCYEGNKLTGYAICKIYAKTSVCECIDLWVEDDKSTKKLINYVESYAKTNECAIIILPHFNSKLGKLYAGSGLTSFKFWDRRDYYRLNESKTLTEENSYFVSLQGDHDIW